MPIALKSLVVVEELDVRPEGLHYVWTDMGLGFATLAARMIHRHRHQMHCITKLGGVRGPQRGDDSFAVRVLQR